MRSKLVPAQIPDGLVVRQRLVDRLSTTARVTLVAVMPGYGKTVAVRQWIDTVDQPVAWLSSICWTAIRCRSGRTSCSCRLGAAGDRRGAGDAACRAGVDDPLFLAALVAELEGVADLVVLILDGLTGQLDQATLDGVALRSHGRISSEN